MYHMGIGGTCLTTYQVQRDAQCIKESIDLEPDVSPEELLRVVKKEDIWNGESLSFAKVMKPYGFDLCLEVNAGTTRIKFIEPAYLPQMESDGGEL